LVLRERALRTVGRIQSHTEATGVSNDLIDRSHYLVVLASIIVRRETSTSRRQASFGKTFADFERGQFAPDVTVDFVSVIEDFYKAHNGLDING
jgi:hypothetical protein